MLGLIAEWRVCVELCMNWCVDHREPRKDSCVKSFELVKQQVSEYRLTSPLFLFQWKTSRVVSQQTFHIIIVFDVADSSVGCSHSDQIPKHYRYILAV